MGIFYQCFYFHVFFQKLFPVTFLHRFLQTMYLHFHFHNITFSQYCIFTILHFHIIKFHIFLKIPENVCLQEFNLN